MMVVRDVIIVTFVCATIPGMIMVLNFARHVVKVMSISLESSGNMEDNIEFTVKCKMKARWVPYFIGMLKLMQNLGGLGGSRGIYFYSDGDGDYRPQFEFEGDLPEPAPGTWRMDDGETCFFDAG